jgi:hypothetical protein
MVSPVFRAVLLPPAVFAFYLMQPGGALAVERLTAIIQSIAAPSVNLRAFDVLSAGTKIKLQAGETIELGYFESCVVERITGGEIVVNERESWVVDGTLERSKTECANGGPAMEGAEADAAVVVVRGAGTGKERVVAGSQPLLVTPGVKGGALAEIRRLDANEEPLTIQMADGVADLAASGQSLKSGGHYQITAGGRVAKFRIIEIPAGADAHALSRLILF